MALIGGGRESGRNFRFRAIGGVVALMLALLHVSQLTAEPIPVYVGGYPYRPYVSAAYDGSGVTAGMIAAFNRLQPDYRFIFKPISANRRYQKMSEQSIDLILFEDPRWDWQGQPVEFSKPFMIDGTAYRDLDLYVTLRVLGEQQSYFSSLDDKALLLTRGYHYSFADFDADESSLKQRFNAYFVDDPETVITMLLSGRGQIGLVTRSLLLRHIARNPEDRARLYVSDRADNVNHLAIVIGQHAPVSKAQIDGWLEQMEQSGELKTLFKAHYLVE